jgi:dTDP-4-dehydrorhamnose 3,5-epimerase
LGLVSGEIDEIILGRENNYVRVRIPKDLWYGFQCISEYTSLIVNCSDLPHNVNDNFIIDLNNGTVPYKW